MYLSVVSSKAIFVFIPSKCYCWMPLKLGWAQEQGVQVSGYHLWCIFFLSGYCWSRDVYIPLMVKTIPDQKYGIYSPHNHHLHLVCQCMLPTILLLISFSSGMGLVQSLSLPYIWTFTEYFFYMDSMLGHWHETEQLTELWARRICCPPASRPGVMLLRDFSKFNWFLSFSSAFSCR